MKVAETLTTRDIGEAENALRANLIRVISTAGLEFGHWVAIQMITNGNASITGSDLSKPLKISVDEAQSLLDSLQAAGIIHQEFDEYCITETGTATVERLRVQVKAITKAVFCELDSNDLIAAHRVLSIIAVRASTLLNAS